MRCRSRARGRSRPWILLGAIVALGGCDAGRVVQSGTEGSAASGHAVAASVETGRSPGDADDPAVWVDPADPARSIVIATDKTEGLRVHDLSGALIQVVPDGDFNNVDLRSGVPWNGIDDTLVVAADDSRRELRVFRVDPATRGLVEVSGSPVATGVRAHGLCLYRSALDGALYAFPNDLDGETEQWRLTDAGAGHLAAQLVRGPWDVGGLVEGCVADDVHGTLFIGEEDRGVWRYGAEPAAPVTERVLVDHTGPGGHLTPDVEGLAILDTGAGEGFLVASSQGENSFSVYQRRPALSSRGPTPGHAFVDRFEISGGAIDGCEDTDGVEIVNRPLGPDFPQGLFVCQDGRNEGGGTNFKLASLGPILELARN